MVLLALIMIFFCTIFIYKCILLYYLYLVLLLHKIYVNVVNLQQIHIVLVMNNVYGMERVAINLNVKILMINQNVMLHYVIGI